jgi:uncharacterized protein (DUF433 family)
MLPKVATADGAPPAIGTGVYGLSDASYLLGIDERVIVRWSQSRSKEQALVPPSHGWAFSFHDLLSLAVIGVLRQRGITPGGIRRTILYLQAEFSTPRPLAHRDIVQALQTAGRSVLLDSGIDVTKGGQMAMLQTLRTYLRPIEYGADRLARLWTPTMHVALNPDVQAGQPCISKTRVTTDVIASRISQGETARAVARDLQITVRQVSAAAQFEARLQSGDGLALVA